MFDQVFAQDFEHFHDPVANRLCLQGFTAIGIDLFTLLIHVVLAINLRHLAESTHERVQFSVACREEDVAFTSGSGYTVDGLCAVTFRASICEVVRYVEVEAEDVANEAHPRSDTSFDDTDVPTQRQVMRGGSLS